MKRLASITVLLLLLLASSNFHLTVYLVKAAEPTSTDAQKKNITYQDTVSIGTSILITVSVQNYACGILGADLVVILKTHSIEIERQNAYVFRYFSQVKTFTFNYIAIEPARIESLTIELYWSNFGKMTLTDIKYFTINIIETPQPSPSLTPKLTPSPTLTPTLTPKITSTPKITPTPTPIQQTPFPSPTPTLTLTPIHTLTPAPTPTIHPSSTATPSSSILPTFTPNTTQIITPPPSLSSSPTLQVPSTLTPNSTSSSTTISTPSAELPPKIPNITPFLIQTPTTPQPHASSIQPSIPTPTLTITPTPKITQQPSSSPTFLLPSSSTPSSLSTPTELPTSTVPDLSPIITNSPSLIQQLSIQSDTYAIIFIAILLSLVIGMWISKKNTYNNQ